MPIDLDVCDEGGMRCHRNGFHDDRTMQHPQRKERIRCVMKYLVMATPLPIPIPPELFLAARDWTAGRMEARAFDCNYMFLGGGGIAIYNAASHEKVYAELLDFPLYGFFEWSVEPLVGWEQGYEIILSRPQRAGD